MSTIGLIAAMRQEIRPFLRLVRPGRRDGLEGQPIWWFRRWGATCVLMECGIGAARAARAARLLCAAHRPALLVSFGVSGATRSDLDVADVVALRAVRALESGRPGPPAVLAPWSATALRAAEGALGRGARLVAGTVITTTGQAYGAFETVGPEHVVLDMETAAIATVAAGIGVPLLGLRSVSDTPDEPLPFEIRAYLDKRDRVRVGRILAGVVLHPGLIPRYTRLARAMGRATRNLVVALDAALGVQLAGRSGRGR